MAPRFAFNAVIMPDQSIVIADGFGQGQQYYNDVWRSTDTGVTWTQLNSHHGYQGVMRQWLFYLMVVW